MTMLVKFGDKFSPTPVSVLNDTRLDSKCKLVMVALVAATSKEDRTHATISMGNLVHYTSLTAPTVRSAIKKLKELGYIVEQKQRLDANGRDKAPEYTLDTNQEIEVPGNTFWGQVVYHEMPDSVKGVDVVYVDYTGDKEHMEFSVDEEVEVKPEKPVGRTAKAMLKAETVRGFPKKQEDGTVRKVVKRTVKKATPDRDYERPAPQQQYQPRQSAPRGGRGTQIRQDTTKVEWEKGKWGTQIGIKLDETPDIPKGYD